MRGPGVGKRSISRLFAVGLLLAGCASAQKPQIYVDNVNGASPASGSPEAIGPISALATCHTNGASSATIQWASNGLAAASVPQDGSAILFLATASGRQFTQINSYTANTVVVQNNFNIALASAVDCAVGGRLLSVATRLALDMEGGSAGWQVVIVATGINHTWTAMRNSSAATAGAGWFGLASGGVRPVIDCNFQPGTCLNAGAAEVVGLQFRNTNPTKTGTLGIDGDVNFSLRDSIIGGADASESWAIGVDAGGLSSIGASVIGSLIQNNEVGILSSGTDFSLGVFANVFRGNDVGLQTDGNTQNAMTVYGNVFWENGVGVELGNNDYNYYNALLFNTFHDNSIAGVSIADPGGIFNLLFASNLLTNNTVGVDYSGAARNIEREAAGILSNCYGLGPTANGSNVDGFVLGEDPINVNPQYVNADNGDFTPLNRDVAFRAWPPGLDGLTPRFYVGTITESEVRCGAIQPGGVGSFSNVGI
jgi:hypothetical protein